MGYKALLFDIDNTIVDHGAPADARAIKFFKYLKKCGFKTIAISNNKEPRVESFCTQVGTDGYIFLAGKPAPNAFFEAMERLDVNPRQTIFVGDQIFTDIWGANNSGVLSVLVEPIHMFKEEPQIILKRFLEMIVLIAYRISVKKNGMVCNIPLRRKKNNKKQIDFKVGEE
ncbi:MAG: HAD-IIIA family hydrolase [Lachnospiraceae bacterium]|nr:HAD-IIIA family hydrolase [Lachnospiraceae bacterium]